MRAAVVEAVRAAPRVGGTGSRLLSGHSRDWDSLEQEFAEFAGTEAALYFGSGYAANVGLLASVLRKDDVVFSDELNHASLIDGMRLSGARKVIYRISISTIWRARCAGRPEMAGADLSCPKACSAWTATSLMSRS